jgi:hypothetical protein
MQLAVSGAAVCGVAQGQPTTQCTYVPCRREHKALVQVAHLQKQLTAVQGQMRSLQAQLDLVAGRGWERCAANKAVAEAAATADGHKQELQRMRTQLVVAQRVAAALLAVQQPRKHTAEDSTAAMDEAIHQKPAGQPQQSKAQARLARPSKPQCCRCCCGGEGVGRPLTAPASDKHQHNQHANCQQGMALLPHPRAHRHQQGTTDGCDSVMEQTEHDRSHM